MGTRKVEMGPVAARVSANVRALREAEHNAWRQRLSLVELSKRLERLGRPVLPSGLSKIESADRRVDADDLVALALALETTPNRLLLTASAGVDKVALTKDVEVTEDDAWRWAAGEANLRAYPWGRPTLVIDHVHFWAEGRPHHPPAEMAVETRERHAGLLEDLDAAWRAARDVGIGRSELTRWLETREKVATDSAGLTDSFTFELNPAGGQALGRPPQSGTYLAQDVKQRSRTLTDDE